MTKSIGDAVARPAAFSYGALLDTKVIARWRTERRAEASLAALQTRSNVCGFQLIERAKVATSVLASYRVLLRLCFSNRWPMLTHGTRYSPVISFVKILDQYNRQNALNSKAMNRCGHLHGKQNSGGRALKARAALIFHDQRESLVR